MSNCGIPVMRSRAVLWVHVVGGINCVPAARARASDFIHGMRPTVGSFDL